MSGQNLFNAFLSDKVKGSRQARLAVVNPGRLKVAYEAPEGIRPSDLAPLPESPRPCLQPPSLPESPRSSKAVTEAAGRLEALGAKAKRRKKKNMKKRRSTVKKERSWCALPSISGAGTESVKTPKLDRTTVREATAFFEEKMVELSQCRNETCAKIVLELSHKWQKQHRLARKTTPAAFWERNLVHTIRKLVLKKKTLTTVRTQEQPAKPKAVSGEKRSAKLDFGKSSKQVEVTMDMAKLRDAGETLGIETGETLTDIRTMLISQDEYESLVDLMKLGIVKEITMKA